MSELALTEIPHPLNTRTDELGSLIPDETVRAAALEQYEQVFFAGWRWNGIAERFFTTNALANFINALDASQLPFVFGDLFRYKAALQVSAASETPGSKLPHDRQVQKKLQACDAFSDKVFSKLILKLRPEVKSVLDAAALAFYLENPHSSPAPVRLSSAERSELLSAVQENNTAWLQKNQQVLANWVAEIVTKFADTQPLFYNQIVMSLARNSQTLELLTSKKLSDHFGSDPQTLMRLVADVQQAIGAHEKSAKYCAEALLQFGITPNTLSLFKDGLEMQNTASVRALLLQEVESGAVVPTIDFGISSERALPFMDALFAACAGEQSLPATGRKKTDSLLYSLVETITRRYMEAAQKDETLNLSISGTERRLQQLKPSEELKRMSWFDAIVRASTKYNRFSPKQVETLHGLLHPTVIFHDTCETVLADTQLRDTTVPKQHVYSHLLQNLDKGMTNFAVLMVQKTKDHSPLSSVQLSPEELVRILSKHPKLKESVMEACSNPRWLLHTAIQNQQISRLFVLEEIAAIVERAHLPDGKHFIEEMQMEFMYQVRGLLRSTEDLSTEQTKKTGTWPEESELAMLSKHPELAEKWYGTGIVNRMKRLETIKAQRLPANATPLEILTRLGPAYTWENLPEQRVTEIVTTLRQKMNQEVDDAIFYTYRDASRAIRAWRSQPKNPDEVMPYLVELFKHKIIFEPTS